MVHKRKAVVRAGVVTPLFETKKDALRIKKQLEKHPLFAKKGYAIRKARGWIIIPVKKKK